MTAQLTPSTLRPFANRQTSVYGYGDVAGDGVALFMRSWEEHETFGEYTCPELGKSNVRVTVNYGGFVVKPLGDNKTLVRWLAAGHRLDSSANSNTRCLPTAQGCLQL